MFGLFTDSEGKVPYVPKNADGTPGTDPLTATSGTDGRMTFKGLDAGTYYLKEISAPAGYVTNSDVVEVKIETTTKEVEVTETIAGKQVTYKTDILESYTVTIGGEKTAEYKFKNANTATSNDIIWETAELVEKPHTFINTQGVELPSTGGMGTTILYVAGSILVLAAGILLVTKRRMNAED